MNLEFGGKSPDVSRVVYTHGTFDGWTKVAAEESFGPDAIVIMIEGGAKFADLHNQVVIRVFFFLDVGHAADLVYFDSDPPQLIHARDLVSIQLRQWIDEFQK
jgi:Serine carboxypeptidase S28